MQKLLIAIFVSLAMLAHAAPNEAQRRKEAKEHFRRGSVAYGASDWDKAIEEYQAAYQLLALPDFVFNLAQAHRQRGNLDAAIEHYQLYLTLDPHGPAVGEAKRYIDELTLAREKQRQQAELKKKEDEAARLEREREAARRAADEARRAAAPSPVPQPVIVEVAPPPPSPPGRALRVSGLVIGAVGVASLALGGAFTGLAASAHHDLFHPQDGRYSPSADDRQRTYETLDVVFFAVGGAALVTGVVLYAVGKKQQR